MKHRQQQLSENPHNNSRDSMGNRGDVPTVDLNLCSRQRHQQQKQQEEVLALMMTGLPPQQQEQKLSTYQPSSTSSIVSPDLSHQLALHMENQKREVQRLLQKQNESLLLILHQQRKRQLGSLLKLVESKASILLKQKEEEVEKANRRTMELTAYVQRTQVENQMWRRIASEHEAAALNLSNNLELMKQNNYYSNHHHGGIRRGDEEEEEGSSMSSSNSSSPSPTRGMCKGCHSRESSVLFFPCRHLCACRVCAGLFDYCPVCKSVKKCCIEVFLP